MTSYVVAVAQLVESRIVIPVVVGSSPISHPNKFKHLARTHPPGFLLSGVHVGAVSGLRGNGRACCLLQKRQTRRVGRAAVHSSLSAWRCLRRKARTPRMNSRCCAVSSPCTKLLFAAVAFPSGVLGPVDCSHGFHCWIASRWRCLRSGDHPLLLLMGRVLQ